ncbi:unnamed protein product [Rotaria magnacalcarata]|uniref:EF-hand domain-containing protein n=1 Tax=Rotaria magnacalcarata TaxID=392030 RepID=A0A814PAN1_9BILA|nr:unnamed protein product [Rotaria magnacalcarata]
MDPFVLRNIFRSRRPSQLTLSQLKQLSNQFNLSAEEIQSWYQHFILCYPYGYVSFQEFLVYLKHLNVDRKNQQYQLPKSLIKQLFYTLDLNKDRELNFEEFFQFNFLINQGTDQDKLKFILTIHDRHSSYYARQEIADILKMLFGLLNISKQTNELSERINMILTSSNMNNNATKICWDTFCTYILNQSSSFQILLSNQLDTENVD